MRMFSTLHSLAVWGYPGLTIVFGTYKTQLQKTIRPSKKIALALL